MKENFIHVCFVIDESGSMLGTENDVIGGFKKVIDEQKANTKGTCSVSYFKFNDNVTEVFRGKDVNEVKELKRGTFFDFSLLNSVIDNRLKEEDKSDEDKAYEYNPGGSTALFDGVGTAINKIGEWLDSMDESEKPEKNLIVIMTDGGENSSREFNSAKVKEMIKHQEEKYNWTFLYMGSDITDAKDANTLNFNNRAYSSKANYSKNYDIVNSYVTGYRGACGSAGEKGVVADAIMKENCFSLTEEYAESMGINTVDLLDNNNSKA